ncbi:hypothetical protein N431DRAFT_543840 [Stipitochalara longipes BDJ]|nr:hypothetical protein N431DRAFT_543840 [Stipitochalara longipes BDJ]
MTNKKATRPRASKAETSSKATGSVIGSVSTSDPAAVESSPATAVLNATNMDEPSQVSDFVVYDNTESGLLKLPNEVKQRIWSLAVTVEEPIVPQQIRDKSNKFIWTKDQINKKTHAIEIGAVPQLTAVQLARLFYTVNEFHFKSGHRSQSPVLTYLVAITEPRRKAIRNIQVRLPCQMSKSNGAQLFTMITACQGLQSLDLKFYWSWGGVPTTPDQLPGFKECLVAVQGLKSFSIGLEEVNPAYGTSFFSAQYERAKSLCKELEPLLKERMTMARSKTYNLTKFRQAQIDAQLDVHGEGRLSEDKKPGLVSSRTRQQVRSLDHMAADGTIPGRESPKYDHNGDLTWNVTSVEQPKEAVLDGIQSVEFLVKTGPLYNKYRVQTGRREKFWEDVTVLNSSNCRHRINDFYEQNPKAYGAQIVLDIWKLREVESGSEEKTKLQTEKRLEATILRQAKAGQKEADEAARQAREAAKAAKADKKALKAKKVKKAKPVKGCH